MAMTGIATARKVPRKRKMTMVTITSVSASVWITSLIELVMNLVVS